jgi:hypothetical protein
MNHLDSQSRPTSALEHPYMLDDLTQNCQRLSARLPPDNWDPDLPAVRIKRQVSGIIRFVAWNNSATNFLAERDYSTDVPEMGRDAATAETRVVGEEDSLLSANNAQRGYTEQRQEKGGHSESQSIFQSVGSWVWPRRTRQQSAPVDSVPATTVLHRVRNNLKQLWPFRASDSGKRPDIRRVGPLGSEPLL